MCRFLAHVALANVLILLQGDNHILACMSEILRGVVSSGVQDLGGFHFVPTVQATVLVWVLLL